MLIEWISLKNIKSFSDVKIHFKGGVNFIKGANGAGKSTIIEAVGFALFNVTTTGFAGGIHSYLLRHGEKEGEVTVCFLANGTRHTVTRTVSPDAGRRKWLIWQEDQQISGLMTDRDRTAYLQDVLGLPADQKTDKLFTDMIGVRQGQFKAPFEETLTNRVKYFNEIFGVADFNRARDNMIAVRRTIIAKKTEYKNLVLALSGTVSQYEGKKEEYAFRLEEQKKVQEAFESLLTKKKKAKEVYDLHTELGTLATEIETTQKNGKKQMLAVCEETEKMNGQLLAAKEHAETEKKEQIEHVKKQTVLDGPVAAAISVLEKDSKSVADYLRGTLQKIAMQRESMIKSLEDAKTDAEKIETGMCPYFDEVCDKMQGRVYKNKTEPLLARLKELDEGYVKVLLRPRKMEWEKHVAVFFDAAEVLCGQYGVKLPEKEELLVPFARYCSAEIDAPSLQEELELLETELPRVLGKMIETAALLRVRLIEENRDLIARVTVAVQTVIGLQKSIADATDRLSALTREQSLLEMKIKRREEILRVLGGNLKNIDEAQAELMQINGEAARADEQKAQNSRMIDSLKKDLTEMEKTLAQINEYKKEDERLTNAGGVSDLLVDLLRRAGGRVAELYTGRVSEKAQTLYSGIAQDGAALHFDTEYDAKLVDIYKGKERVRSFNQLSGGQKMIAALCVRIAILNSFSGVPIVFLDEPTENIDAEKKQNLAENLRKPLQGFSQIFIISHDDAFDRLTENVILLEETRGGTVCVAL